MRIFQVLKPNRLEASKNVAIEFIQKRKNDRVGLVIFSGESFTQCPLTTDHNVLVNLFKDVLVANKECESATLEVSEGGLAKINFTYREVHKFILGNLVRLFTWYIF